MLAKHAGEGEEAPPQATTSTSRPHNNISRYSILFSDLKFDEFLPSRAMPVPVLPLNEKTVAPKQSAGPKGSGPLFNSGHDMVPSSSSKHRHGRVGTKRQNQKKTQQHANSTHLSARFSGLSHCYGALARQQQRNKYRQHVPAHTVRNRRAHTTKTIVLPRCPSRSHQGGLPSGRWHSTANGPWSAARGSPGGSRSSSWTCSARPA